MKHCVDIEMPLHTNSEIYFPIYIVLLLVTMILFMQNLS